MDGRRGLQGWGRTNPSVATVHRAGDDGELCRLVAEAGPRGVLTRGWSATLDQLPRRRRDHALGFRPKQLAVARLYAVNRAEQFAPLRPVGVGGSRTTVCGGGG